jgi:hypothetical protein
MRELLMPTSTRMLNRRAGNWFRTAFAASGMLALALAWGRPTPAPAQLPLVAPASVAPISPAGQWLSKFLDRMDVTHHWLRGNEHIAWKTGLPLLEEHGHKLTPLADDETHCSAFAAAVADGLGIYLLHPPEHSHVLLANAQFDWLPSDAGRKAGWSPVESPVEAQSLANEGELVIAVYKNPDATQSGHIAVVCPDAKAADAILAKGPQITQAGWTNYRSADLAAGFDHHPGAWKPDGRGGVRFYSHPIKPEDLAGE